MHPERSSKPKKHQVRMIAWEVTRRCNPSCSHCRASADNEPPKGELSYHECRDFLSGLSDWAKPVIILTGGEPLLQWEFCQELLKVCKEAGIHTAIETNASVSWERLEAVFPLTDMIMADVKLFDSKLHQQWTGIPNHRILENIQRLNQEKTHLIIRTPVIPGVNDNEREISAIANFVASLEHVIAYELLPFHPLGSPKYTSLAMKNPLEMNRSPDQHLLTSLQTIAAEHGAPIA